MIQKFFALMLICSYLAGSCVSAGVERQPGEKRRDGMGYAE